MNEPQRILLVEDNPGDARLIQEALAQRRSREVNVVTDGVAALDFLRDGIPPELIILDLNLPKKDGREVLAEIKQDAVLRRIPIVVLTTSESEEDVGRTYDLHANCFITKPVNLDRFMAVVKAIEEYWFGIVTLPPR